jgi:predicted  nucleic acid-binding Zn-ribbon protein
VLLSVCLLELSKMKSLTVEQIMNFKPCYSRAEVEAVFNGRESLTLAEILAADIPPEDRIWVLTRPGVMTPEQVKTFCDKTADRAVRNHCLNCGIKAVEEWAARWLSGEDRTAGAADSAAYSAAMAADSAARAADSAAMAADSAARAANSAAMATWEAAWEAAYSAADSAAYSAADSAAYSAAMAAEREKQVCDLLEIIA